MKRYYICPVVGSGTDLDPYRAKVADYGMNHSAEIPTDANGLPTADWCLAVVAATNHSALLADPQIKALPDFPLDGKVNAIQQATKIAMRALLIAKGIPGTLMDNADGYRDVIRAIGQQLNPHFSENAFDVSE